jgi:vacuolar protein sorting-associated protein 13D
VNLQGLILGLGRGIVGTVTKPVMGTLDFVSDMASAIRDSSKKCGFFHRANFQNANIFEISSSHVTFSRCRLPRCIVGPGGLLPTYSLKQSEGQQFLHQINRNLYAEMYN